MKWETGSWETGAWAHGAAASRHLGGCSPAWLVLPTHYVAGLGALFGWPTSDLSAVQLSTISSCVLALFGCARRQYNPGCNMALVPPRLPHTRTEQSQRCTAHNGRLASYPVLLSECTALKTYPHSVARVHSKGGTIPRRYFEFDCVSRSQCVEGA